MNNHLYYQESGIRNQESGKIGFKWLPVLLCAFTIIILANLTYELALKLTPFSYLNPIYTIIYISIISIIYPYTMRHTDIRNKKFSRLICILMITFTIYSQWAIGGYQNPLNSINTNIKLSPLNIIKNNSSIHYTSFGYEISGIYQYATWLIELSVFMFITTLSAKVGMHPVYSENQRKKMENHLGTYYIPYIEDEQKFKESLERSPENTFNIICNLGQSIENLRFSELFYLSCSGDDMAYMTISSTTNTKNNDGELEGKMNVLFFDFKVPFLVAKKIAEHLKDSKKE